MTRARGRVAGTRTRPAWLLLTAAVVFGAVLAYPYLSLDPNRSRIEVSDQVHYGVLVLHVVTATLALLVGPLQFMPRVRAHRRLHRALGRTYLGVGVLPAALTAIPVAAWSGNLLTQTSLSVAAAVWLVTGTLAYRAARRRDFSAHRAWMMRNYALTFLAVTSRILVPLLLLVQIPFGAVSAGEIGLRAPSMIPVGQTLGWILDLLVVEVLLVRSGQGLFVRRGRHDDGTR